MIFQPAIIALLLASTLCVLALVASTPFAIDLIRRWDSGSGSALQIRLERRTYLFSTLLAFVLVVQLAATLLFVFNGEKMSVMFVGAMCAVGTLNMNPYGFPALNAKILIFFLAAMWLAINHVDSRARDYPLVRIKYALLLLLLTPLLLASAWIELQFFLNLKADVITSCCGSLFSANASSVVAKTATLAPLPAMILFYAAMGLAIGTASFHWALIPAPPRLPFRRGDGGSQAQPAPCCWQAPAWGSPAQGPVGMRSGRYSGTFVALGAALGFVAAITGILSFLSLYVYAHPHHHCPFCLLKPEYGYQGYLFYVPLFVATAAGLAVGALQPFASVASLRISVPAFSRQLAAIASLGFLLATAVASMMILRSKLILIEL